MDRFYQFLQEMPTLIKSYPKDQKYKDMTYMGRFNYKYDNTKKVGDYNKDYEVHHHGNRIGSINDYKAAYSLYHKPTRNYHMIVQGEHSTRDNGTIPQGEFHIDYLQGHPATNVKAHDFYHHLTNKLGVTLNSDSDQSVGGLKVWHKLSQNPEVHVTHHDISGNQLPISKPFVKNYTYTNKKSEPDHVLAYSTFRAKRLDEMPTMLTWLALSKQKKHVDYEPSGDHIGGTKIGDYNHEYELHHHQYGPPGFGGDKEHVYSLKHKPTGETHVLMHGYPASGNFNIKYVESSEASKVKAHDFYHHLITKHGMSLRSDVHQSEGGAKIWQRLADKPDIDVEHHNRYGHPIHLDRWNWHHNYTGETKPENTLTFSHFIARKK